MKIKDMSNRQFSNGGTDSIGNKFKANDTFLEACKKAGVKPTVRQASKYRQCKGVAYKFKKHQSTYLKRQVALNLATAVG